MGFEARKGNLYYYRKRRQGKRVVSEYVGNGEIAYIADRFIKDKAQWREEDRANEAALRACDARGVDQDLDRFSQSVDAMTDCYLEVLGYHRHKGQWRRERD
jgi:hypothetical protein